MGTIRFTTTPAGDQVGLYDHEGYVAQVFDDGTTHGGGNVAEVNRRTVGFQAACDCGWHGATVLPRQPDQTAWCAWDDLPVLEDEWTAHTDPFLDALARDSGLSDWAAPSVPATGGDIPAPGLTEEIVAVLAEIRALADGTIAESERQRIMGRKRRLIDRIEPGFYDTHLATDADDEPTRHRLEAEALSARPEPDQPGPGLGAIVEAWSLVEGDVHLPAAEADWWGATLSILVAAIHHPAVLAAQQPDTDPVDVAREVLAEIGSLRQAVELAERAKRPGTGDAVTAVVTSRGEGPSRRVVISPGGELRHLVWVLDVFAHAVTEPGRHAVAHESATGHAAAAWARDLASAAGATP